MIAKAVESKQQGKKKKQVLVDSWSEDGSVHSNT